MTMTPRWNLKVHDDNGRARLVISDGTNPIGVFTLQWGDYVLLTRHLTQRLLTISRESIKKTLHERIWKDALNKCEGSAELAQKKLLELGWNAEQIETYAEELSRQLTHEILSNMPEHR